MYYSLQYLVLADSTPADNAARLGSVQCYWAKSCAGANDSNCYPYAAWSGVMHSSDVYYAPIHLLNGSVGLTGSCNTGYCDSTYALSVRCSPRI